MVSIPLKTHRFNQLIAEHRDLLHTDIQFVKNNKPPNSSVYNLIS